MSGPVSGGDHGGVLEVAGGGTLVGRVRVPGDKSISHRALLLAALADGESTIHGLSDGDDVRRTGLALQRLGAVVDGLDGPGPVVVRGGRHRLAAPDGPLDLGNSGTGMRLFAGLVAGVTGTTTLVGDDSLSGRPMDRVAVPLRAMGATVDGTGERCLPPLVVTGGRLVGIDYRLPVASAQVKSAVLLAGLDADGETVVHEPVPTRTHTEELLAAAGADIDVAVEGEGRVVRVRRSTLRPGDTTVPGDPSQAAFWVVGATLVPGGAVDVEGIYLGPQRTGFVDVLVRMGADIEVRPTAGGAGSLSCRYAALRGTVVRAEEIPSLDEVPILAVAAAVARGETRFCDVGELRVKESDRLQGTADLLAAFGARATVEGDDLVVAGGAVLAPGRVDARGDHRMAMAAAVAGAACPRDGAVTTITGWGAVGTSYPGFAEDLSALSRGEAA